VTPELTASRLGINPAKVVHETIDGEAILIQLERGNYFSLAGSGQELWALLSSGHTAAEAVGLLAERYAVSAGEIEPWAAGLVEELVSEELLSPVDGEGAPAGSRNGAVLSDVPGQFAPVKLEKYTDMQDHLLIDPIHDVSDSGWPSVEPAE
jgi:hypothetical protein